LLPGDAILTGTTSGVGPIQSGDKLEVRIQGLAPLYARLRAVAAVAGANADLARKLETLEKKYDAQFKVVFDAIRQLMSPPAKPRREIGFHVKYDDDKPKAKKR
jgi:hypothetical protein